MEYATDSDIVVKLTWWVTLVSAILSYLIIVFVIGYRGYIGMLNKRREKIDQRWQDVLYTVVGSDDESFARLSIEDLVPLALRKKTALRKVESELEKTEYISPEEIPHFLFIWNYLQESLKGNARDRLNLFAEKFELKQKALRLLRSHLLKNRLLAINTLGNLEAIDTYPEVLKYAGKRDPVVSVWAYRAMFRIRPQETLRNHLHLIAERKDWSPAHIAKILSDCGSEMISEKLTRIVFEYYSNGLEEKQLARLISYLKFANERDYQRLIDEILSDSDQMEVLIAAMRLLKSSNSLPKVRKLLKSESWQLRMYAAMTLGRFGERQDARLLINTLGDLDWWVRYHSARALVSMPLISTEKLKKLSEKLPDEFQRDILRQVLAEEEFQCQSPTSSGLSS